MKPLDRVELAVELMKKMWGIAYRWGGDDPMAGFDCSGGVQEILRSIGVLTGKGDLNAQLLYNLFVQPLNGEELDLEVTPPAGCLIFFGKSKKEISHVAMSYNGEIMFEFGGGGSSTTSEAAAVAQNAYGRFRPITARKDLVAFVRINLLRFS